MYIEQLGENIKDIMATTTSFDGWLSEQQNPAPMSLQRRNCSKLYNLSRLVRPQDLMARRWSFYLGFQDVVVEDLLLSMEESRCLGKI